MAGDHYTLSSGEPRSTTVHLNGAALKLGAGDDLPVLAGLPLRAGNGEFAPATITFLALPEARNGVCR